MKTIHVGSAGVYGLFNDWTMKYRPSEKLLPKEQRHELTPEEIAEEMKKPWARQPKPPKDPKPETKFTTAGASAPRLYPHNGPNTVPDEFGAAKGRAGGNV